MLLIPGSLGINQNGACLIDAGAKLTILGSVINDCGDKHYNKGDASGYLYVMQMGRHDHPRSIVTDHYLLDHYADALISVYVTNERVGWSC